MLKRAIDILLSFIAITLLLPLMTIVSVLVYFKLGPPIFFTQERPGFNEKVFKMFKFRSMLNLTDKSGKLLSDEERLTGFGKTLRSTSLDELPGLINVLKGDMSIVGPRPLLVDYLPLYNKRQSKRHNVRPGITGWAQVNGRNAISWEQKFELDVWYIENQSLLLDLKIMFMTFGKVFKRADISSEVSVTMEKFIGSIKEELFMKDIVIIGAGGVGREIAWLIEQINNVKATFNILGFIDDNYELHGKNINGYKVFGGTDYLLTMDQNINVVCAIANYKVKKRIIEKLSLRQFHYPTIIHPEVYISNTNTVGRGCVIYPGVIITTNIRLGDYIIISPKCGIGHEAVIEDYSSILWNVSISGNVKIEEGCLIGSGSTIIQGKSIGRESIVGAGAVVVKDIPEKCTAVGVPAKIVKFNQ